MYTSNTCWGYWKAQITQNLICISIEGPIPESLVRQNARWLLPPLLCSFLAPKPAGCPSAASSRPGKWPPWMVWAESHHRGQRVGCLLTSNKVTQSILVGKVEKERSGDSQVGSIQYWCGRESTGVGVTQGYVWIPVLSITCFKKKFYFKIAVSSSAVVRNRERSCTLYLVSPIIWFWPWARLAKSHFIHLYNGRNNNTYHKRLF